MGSILMTPGVYFTETDISQYIKNLSSTMLALVGVASKGPLNEAVLITTYSELTANFGIPTEDYPALLVAREFLNAGGTQLFFVRVAQEDLAATVTVPQIDGTHHNIFTGATTGSFFNQVSLNVSYGTQKTTSVTHSETLTITSTQNFTLTIPNAPVVPQTVIVKYGGTQVATDDGAGNLVFISGDSVFTGTVNYDTGAVAITATNQLSAETIAVVVNAVYYSTFNIQVVLTTKDQNGNVVGTFVEETFICSIGTTVDQLASSQYITVDDEPTTFPTAGTFQLTGGDDGADEIEDIDYIGNTLGATPTGLQIFAFPDEIDINLVGIPGASQSSAVRQALIQLAGETRQDCLALLDPPADATVQTVADWANGEGSYSDYGVIDTTYAAIYYPYFGSNNNITGAVDNTPPSAAVVQAFARSQYWQAPAGPNRGLLQNVTAPNVKLTPGDRVFLGANRVNPIGNLAGLGIMVLGQQTATEIASSLDRVGARMTLIQIEKAITTAMYPFLFEPNFPSTWLRATNLVQPYLNTLVSQQRLYSATFICNATTNTSDVINNNEMACVVQLQLPKYTEIILINFQITELGATITENVSN